MTDRTTTDADDFESRLTTALRSHYPAGPFPNAEIERDLRRTLMKRDTAASVTRRGPWWTGTAARSLLAAAASVLVFVAGVEYGRHTVDTAAADSWTIPSEPNRPAATRLPLSIQASGGRYVASLAELNEQAPALSETQLRIGREVAMMALYAAAVELLRVYGEDPILRDAVRSLGAGTAEFVVPRDVRD